ncbi:MAG: 50S ribosomal protein L10 [Spirochaetia bacterium]
MMADVKEKKIQQYKLDAVAELKTQFGDVRDFIFTDYRGLTVEQITELRNRLREKQAEYHVVKNRYAKIAIKQLEMPDVSEYLVGPTALALAKDESGPVAKILLAFGKETSVAVKGAIINGNVYTSEEVDAYSKLPTREELIAKLMGTMNAPLQHLVYAMNGVTQKLVRVLQAVADKKGE